MKRIISAILVLSTFAAFAQTQSSSWCGTVLTDEYRREFFAKDRTNPAQTGQRAIRWIAVYYHVVTKNDGTGGASLNKIFISHCELNEVYNPFDIGFYISGIDTIKNTTLWNYQNSSLGYQAFSQYNKSNRCNIYINGNLPGLCGFATFPSGNGTGGGIFMNVGCIGTDTKTLPHEMGHYLGLLHTFDDSDGVEFVDGSNCATAGDGFCDTPADFLDDRTPCPYTGNQTDGHGDFYKDVIDESLIMSYFYDACVTRFSTQQKDEMNDVLTTRRPFLLTQPQPDLSPLPAPTLLAPPAGDTTLMAGQSTTFRWSSVPGAMYYLFTLQSATSSVIYMDSLTTDTSIVFSNFASNKSYKFKVKPLSYGNTCSPATAFQTVYTTPIKVAITTTTANCAGDNNGTITLTPSAGTAPYDIQWSSGDVGTGITNLAPGTYTFTITDAAGEVGIGNVTITAPDELVVTVNSVGNNLNAIGVGGVTPYTYSWSNGITTSANNNVQPGYYTVTITDANGCTAEQTFAYGISSTGIDMALKASMKIFPNPASQNMLNIQVTLNERVDATINLVNMNGAVVQQMNRDLEVGTNTLQFNLSAVPAGVYLVQFKTGELMTTQRLTVVR